MLVHQSQTRRKACNWCVKGKRRCDLSLPRCGRCATRDLDCQYKKAVCYISLEYPGDISDRVPLASHMVDSVELLREPNFKSIDYIPSVSLGIEWTYEPDTSMCRLMNFGLPLDHAPSVEPTVVKDGQVRYCISKLKRNIDLIVLDNETYFIHSSTYTEDAMPSAYQDAISVCALYRQVTPQTQKRVFQMLDNKLNTLIQESVTATWGVSEILLAVQVLILYQTIRLFDGDDTQRKNAELQFKLLGTWTGHLQRAYSEAEQTSFLRTPYQQWILLESIRRTVMASVLLRTIYCRMKIGICDLAPLLAVLPVCSNSLLWTLDESRWVEEMNRGGSRIHSFNGFIVEWNQGNVRNVDDYEKVLLVACPCAHGTTNWSLLDNY